MSKKLDLQSITPGAWAVLAVLIASCAAIVIWAPAHFWDSLSRADWRHVSGVITLVGGSFVALIVQFRREMREGPGLSSAPRWEQPGYDDEDPTGPQSPRAIERRDRLPGDSARPSRRREGSASPTALAGLLTLVLVAIAALALSGCVSAVRVHATVASTTGATIDTWCQEEVARRDVEQRAAEAAHPYREDAAAAVAEVRARYEPALGGCGVAKGLHDGWVEGIALGHAGAPFDVIDVARRFVAPLAETWQGIARATAQSDHPAPALPPEIVTIADAIAPREDEDR